MAERAGFGLVLSPMFEDARLFRRGFGDESEVVSKEMYEFTDRDGRRLALRPEGTAPVVRAFVQHHPPVPWKAWYVTPAFRHEQPQAGRYRQHHQVGVEVLGTDDPDLDVEVIALAAVFYSRSGLARIDLAVNSMGCAEVAGRLRRRPAARSWPSTPTSCATSTAQRYAANPLRVLDCKSPECRAVTEDAPKLVDFLDDGLRRPLRPVPVGASSRSGSSITLEPRLVRGSTTTRGPPSSSPAVALEAAQNAVGGGGRYDGLVETARRTATPGIGFGIGIERLLLACDAEGCFAVAPPARRLRRRHHRGRSRARDLARSCGGRGSVPQSLRPRSPKAQMKLADHSGARFAVIVGPDGARGMAR